MFEYTFYWSIVWNKLPVLLEGAWLTLQVTFYSMVIGTLIAWPLAIMRMSRLRVLKYSSSVWVEVSRNTPALFQIYMTYFGLGAMGIDIPSFTALLIALTFNNAGYLAEIFRGGFSAIPKTQMSASKSLGMSTTHSYLYIIIPQVFALVYLPFVNQLNWALLNSSLGSIIGVADLTGATQSALSESYRTFEFFLVAAGIYYLLSKSLSVASHFCAWVFLSKR